ncbi:transglutaminase domain-containing protein [Bacillus shivajii]|uniref:DUF4129 domain-containing transglutaminase family protein n=1 Tax=Bacillus shivajii TaxID=1983719 RepID=UPI001CFC0008|nr:transglutaminase domain-containing protein [Bacillus shivajii]UCZ53778.1 transglutaminase domain-containing protein [Bacillus shivajii]
MRKRNEQPKATITHFFIYTLAFLILWEWLRPIPVVTNTGHIDVFVLFALFSAVLIYLRIPLYFSLPALFIGSIYGLHYIFSGGSFFSREGGGETIRSFLHELTYNIQLIFSWELVALTDVFRTFLLFLLLALVCYLIYFWVFYTQKIFFFLLATVIYITVLDTFTPVDASMAIVRIVIIGFFIMTLLHMLKVQEVERAIGRRSTAFISSAWMYTLIFVILIATSIGYTAPKFEPQWEDPVPTFQQYVLGENGTGTGEGVRRVGYGENDERLGGGFIQDHGTVFYAAIEEPAYWRGESKHEYTGHGWVSEPTYVDSRSIYGEGIDYRMFNSAYNEELETTVMMEEGIGFNHFFYPGELTDVDVDSLDYLVNGTSGGGIPLQFLTDIVGGRVMAQTNNNDDLQLTQYTIQYNNPQFEIEALKNSSIEDPDEIRELYLQLPDDLPERVVELAEEITEDLDNRYDMAVAVEQYFSENDFEYRTTNIPIPDEGEDYVDQFLFETQYGYCDNYSTSMAVMLRAIDIPARWVKGFTQGEEIETLDDGKKRFEITNSNAHSWVEVYFPDVGWVPFEPTQGFDNNVEFIEEEEESIEIDLDEREDAEDQERDMPNLDDMNPEMEDYDDTDASAIGGGGGSSDLFAEYLTPKNVLISIVVLVLVMIIYQKQNLLQNRYFMLRYKLSQSDDQFTPAYRRLLWILENEGLPMGDGETLREYASRVDRVLNSLSMTKLTETYEKIYYGKRDVEIDWKKHQKHWQELVKSLNS